LQQREEGTCEFELEVQRYFPGDDRCVGWIVEGYGRPVKEERRKRDYTLVLGGRERRGGCIHGPSEGMRLSRRILKKSLTAMTRNVKEK